MAVRLVTRRQRRSCRVLSLSLLLAAALLVWVGIRLPHDVKAAAFGRSKAARRSRVRSTRTVPYKFFDAGGTVYHDINFTCPVPWEWVEDMDQAEVVWYNVLGGLGLDEKEKVERSHPDQKTVLMSLESGGYYPIVYESKQAGYDFSVDYRIWPGHPHGSADVPAVYLLNPTMPDFPIDFRKPPTMPKRTDALVAAFISNCNPLNGRQDVLQALIDAGIAHSYGACSHNRDEDDEGGGKEGKVALAGQYHFIFVPENSQDVSYVTEKVYDGFESGAVPVYMGAPDIDRFVPHPSAIIKVSDFATTDLLIAHLKAVAASKKLYMKHFDWKRRNFTKDFRRVLRLASRTVQCRLAMKLEGLPMEDD